MKKLIVLSIMLLICLITAKIDPVKAEIPVNNDLITMRADINTLNLLNGLYLSKDQMKEYLRILNEYKLLEKQAISKTNNFYTKQKLSFAKYRNELAKNNGISKKTLDEAKYHDDSMKEAIIKYNYQKQDFEKKLEVLLNKNQKVVVNGYIPCLIPPDILKDPSRVGQAEDNSEVKEGLTKLRTMNPIIYFVFREFWLSKYFEFYENHLKVMSNNDKDIERQRLFKIFDETRAMKEADFQLNRDEISRKVVAKIRGEMLNYRKCDAHILGKTLLNINMIPIIEQRLAMSK